MLLLGTADLSCVSVYYSDGGMHFLLLDVHGSSFHVVDVTLLLDYRSASAGSHAEMHNLELCCRCILLMYRYVLCSLYRMSVYLCGFRQLRLGSIIGDIMVGRSAGDAVQCCCD